MDMYSIQAKSDLSYEWMGVGTNIHSFLLDFRFRKFLASNLSQRHKQLMVIYILDVETRFGTGIRQLENSNWPDFMDSKRIQQMNTILPRRNAGGFFSPIVPILTWPFTIFPTFRLIFLLKKAVFEKNNYFCIVKYALTDKNEQLSYDIQAF